jgi:hypothetical protein
LPLKINYEIEKRRRIGGNWKKDPHSQDHTLVIPIQLQGRVRKMSEPVICVHGRPRNIEKLEQNYFPETRNDQSLEGEIFKAPHPIKKALSI